MTSAFPCEDYFNHLNEKHKSNEDVIYDESGLVIGNAGKLKKLPIEPLKFTDLGSYEEFKAMTANLVTPPQEEKISYKYAEDSIIADFKAYIDKTYGQHYQTENNVQCFDAWIALDDATPTFRNTAIKYLWRYGKKSGNNKDDLMKVLHYTMMCLYNDHYKKGE
jgi:hypothetical protein